MVRIRCNVSGAWNRLLYNYGNGRVMHMADFWEQVMFYLKIQAAYKPTDQFIAGVQN
jgi:hypothetical protein